MDHCYILDGKEPIPCNYQVWAIWFQNADRILKKTKVTREITVSTVFVGLSVPMEGPPMVFETMVFGGPRDGHEMRYASWDEAMEDHERIVAETQACLDGSNVKKFRKKA